MRSFFRSISIILLVLWMGFIFYMSAQPADVSNEMSGGVIEAVAEKVYPYFEELSADEQNEVVESFQFVVRKSAHVAVFAVLGFLSFLCFVSYTNLRFIVRDLLSIGLGLLYAVSDELHQLFVNGRSCEFRDILLDACGIIGATLISCLIVKLVPVLRRITAFEKSDAFDYEEVAEHENLLFYNEVEQLKEDAEVEDVEESIDVVEESIEDVAKFESAILEKDIAIESLTASLAEQTEEIIKLKAQNREFNMNLQKGKELSSEMQYAASVIGKAVIEVTKVCNEILTRDKSDNSKELVNLALGRNEVLKANILKILDEEIEFSQKQELIDKEKSEAIDYFNSIIAQIC